MLLFTVIILSSEKFTVGDRGGISIIIMTVSGACKRPRIHMLMVGIPLGDLFGIFDTFDLSMIKTDLKKLSCNDHAFPFYGLNDLV